jgi:hypothetical protein
MTSFALAAEYASAVLSGRCTLPSLAQRHRWLSRYEANLKARGFYDDKYHYLGDDTDQWEYCRLLARLAHLPGTAGAAAAESQPQQQDENHSSEINARNYNSMTHIAVMEGIYDDNAAFRFQEPGAPDTYRRYRVNW